MNSAKSMVILNKLVLVNNDRIDGYDYAIRNLGQPILKLLFTDFSTMAKRLNEDLIDEIECLDGIVVQGTSKDGELFFAWQNVKSAVNIDDRFELLDACEYAENCALTVFENALNDQARFLSGDQVEMIRYQCAVIKWNFDSIRNQSVELKNQRGQLKMA